MAAVGIHGERRRRGACEREKTMPVYMIIESRVKDLTKYQQYIAAVPPIVAKYGGRYVVRGGTITTIIGDWKPERVIVLEFPAEANIKAWLASAEYKAIAPLRDEGAELRAIVVQGCEGDRI